MKSCIQYILALSLSLSLLSGCATPPKEDRHLTLNEKRALLARAKNPRSLYLTVFEGPAGPEFENSYRLHPSQVTRETFTGEDDLPAIIAFKGAPNVTYNALVDPSTPESWASAPMKKIIPLTPLGPPYYQVQAAHLAATRPGFMASASTIKMNTVFVESALFAIRDNVGDLGPFARGQTNAMPDVVLGNQFLEAFRFVQFNYPKKEFPTPGGTLLSKLPMHSIRGALGTIGLVNGRETKVLLDLAGDYSIALPDKPSSSTMRVHLGDIALSGLDPVTAESLNLIPSPYPRIGWRALKQFVITLDYKRRVIWFERP